MDQGAREARPKNPRQSASAFSIITFFYTLSLFKKGRKKDLDDEDVYEIIPKLSSKKLGDNLENVWKIYAEKRDKQNTSVIRVLCSCFARKYLLLGLIQFWEKTALILIQPLATSKLIGYFEPNSAVTTKEAFMYAAVVIVVNILNTVYNHNYLLFVTEFGISVKTSLAALIYRKALKLKHTAFSDISMGNIVTLITKDVGVFEAASIFINEMWIGMVQTVILTYLIYTQIGWSVLAGIGFFIIIIPLQAYIGHKTSMTRLKSAKNTDERLQTTKEAFSAIKIIKMYTWEKFFQEKINVSRKKEVNTLAVIYYMKAFIIIIGTLVSNISIYLLIMTYIWTGHFIRAEVIYFIQSCFLFLKYYITISIPMGIAQLADMVASIKRIEHFLNGEEYSEDQQSKVVHEPKVELRNVSVNIKGTEVLKDVSLIAIKNSLCLVSGNVGSGKSVLLKTIMRDYPITKGYMLVEGTISYTSQEPWLFPSTIKQNILFGQDFNEKKYQKVLSVCALTLDLGEFKNGDETIVGDRGVNLSKGQQARINLARAVYKDSDIYLLDDCLSSVDTHVNKYVFRHCIKEFLKDKIVILVTHNIDHIKEVYGKNVLFMEDGTTLTTEQQKQSLDNRITCCMDDEDLNYYEGQEESDKVPLQEEENHAGDETTLLLKSNGIQKPVKNLYHEEKKSGKVSLSVYHRYYKFAGGILVFVLITIVFVAGHIALAYIDKILGNWVNLEPKIANYTSNNRTDTKEYDQVLAERYRLIILYTIFNIMASVLAFAGAYANFFFCLRASKNLHKSIIFSILNSFMNFFDCHLIGNIINRFSKDLAIIDENIPYIIYENFRCILAFVGIILLIASVNVMFLIPSGLLLLILYLVRRFYLPTGRGLKRLESATRCPMIGYLNATLEGLTTVRAYEKQTMLIEEFDKHQDLYTSAYYMMQCTVRSFGFVLDMICCFFLAPIVLSLFIGDTQAGDAGLAICQAMLLTSQLQWTIRQISELENYMTSVERALEYTDVQTEDKQIGRTLNHWPTEGKIEYIRVSLTYSTTTSLCGTTKEPVLKDIRFVIEPRQKIGIVGRTGAGKSSLISTLFRLYDIQGQILIDGVDTKTLSLDFLRSKITIIPQDPILFTGTIRSNIDPTGKYTDAEIWESLEKVNLKQTGLSLEEEGCPNYSTGQRQLICLARALVSKNKIIILDEATASMDSQTCSLIQDIIKKNFADCTVINIAHRLNTVLKSDKVMVVDGGQIVEYDKPNILLENRDSAFYSMIEQAGLLDKINTY